MESYVNPSNVSYAYAAYALVAAVVGTYLALLLRRLSRQRRAFASVRVLKKD